MSDLLDGADCIHALARDTCAICRHADKPCVYVTGGGLHYHRRRNCPALQAGQANVESRGGDVAPVTTARFGTADVENRKPCKTCWP